MGRVVTVLLVLALAWFGLAWIRRVPAEAPLLVAAHRGAPASSREPENTIAAFREAIEDGAGALELDVRRTSDGVLVVLHDATIDRTTDGTGALADLTFDELERLEANEDEQVPTVAEVVRLARDAELPVFAEIKDGPAQDGIVGELVALLDEEAWLDHTTLLAFEPEVLVEAEALSTDVATCWLTGLGTFDVSDAPEDVDAVCPAGEMLLLNPWQIADAHGAGRQVFAWWSAVETAVTTDLLDAYGVDGVMLDDLGNAP